MYSDKIVDCRLLLNKLQFLLNQLNSIIFLTLQSERAEAINPNKMNLLFIQHLAFAISFTLVLNDSFQDLSNWKFIDQAGYSTGNNEHQYYRPVPKNIHRVMHPYGRALKITARSENYEGYSYTSGKIISKNKVGPYGFINIRALVPKTYLVSPGILLLPENGLNAYGAWAACGHIIMLETKCFESDSRSFIFYGGSPPNQKMYPDYVDTRIPTEIDWNVPHSFGLEWTQSYLKFWFDSKMVDGEIQGFNYMTINSDVWYSMSDNGDLYHSGAPFDVATNINIFLALGGDYVCSVPDCCSNYQLPASLFIFNVQVWSL